MKVKIYAPDEQRAWSTLFNAEGWSIHSREWLSHAAKTGEGWGAVSLYVELLKVIPPFGADNLPCYVFEVTP